MKSVHTLLPVLGSLLSFLTRPALSLELQPIAPPQAGLDARSVDYSSLTLQNSETFLWGGADNNRAALANLTVLMPGDSESIINLEKFKSLVTSMQCSDNSTTLKLQNDEAFTKLMNAWEWTNQADNHTFVLVAGSGDCGWNDRRQPFVISSVSFDNATNTATLAGHPSDWKTVAHSYHLQVGGVPTSSLVQRDYSDSYTLNFTHEINFGTWTIPVDDHLQVTLNCKSCSTTGEFDFKFDISTFLGIPDGATLTLNPKGVSAVITPTVGLAGDLSGKKSFTDKFLTIPIDGITIADIIDLGPTIAFSGSLNIGPLKGTATVTAGVTLTLDDSADLTIDLLKPSDCKADNWSPEVTGDAPKVTAMISGGVSLGVLADVEFDITVLGKGLSAGIGLQPLVGATLSAIDSSSGACANDPEHHEFGVQLAPSAGVYLQASVSDVATVTITSETISLSTDCYGFGSPLTTSAVATTTGASSTAVPTSATITSTATPSSAPIIPSSRATVPPRVPSSSAVAVPTSSA